MVIQSFAQTEYDLNTQELKVFSRHAFDKKGLKIVGAVSVIFVQPSGQNDNVDEWHQTVEEVSSSLSVVTLPDFTGNRLSEKQHNITGYRTNVTLPDNHVNTTNDEFVNNHNVSIIDFSKPVETSCQPQHTNQSHVSNDTSRSQSINILNQNVSNQSQDIQGHISNHERNVPGRVSSEIQNVPTHPSNQTAKISNALSTAYGPTRNISKINLPSSKHFQRSREISNAIARINNKQIYNNHIDMKDQDNSNQKIVQLSQEKRMHIPFKSRPLRPVRIKALVVTKEKKNDVNCSICQLKLDSCTDIIAHSKLHNLDLACCVCEAKFASYCNMRRHCAGHVQTILYMCSFCHCSYKRKDNLQTHIKKHYIQAGVPSFRQQAKYSYVKTTSRPTTKDHDVENQNENQESEKSNSESNDLSIMQTNIGNTTRTLVNSAPEYSSFKGGNNLSNSIDNQIDLTSDDEQISECYKIVEKALIGIADISQNPEVSSKTTSSTPIEGELSQMQESEGMAGLVENKSPESSSSPPNQILNYSCSSCNIQFDQVESLKRHILSSHSEEIPEQTQSNNDNSTITSSDFIKIEMFEEANDSGNPYAEKSQQMVDIGNLSSYTSYNQIGDTTKEDSNLMTFPSVSPLKSPANPANMNSNSSLKSNKSLKRGRQGDRLGSITPICRICGVMFKEIQQVIDHKAEHPTEIPQMFGCTICNADLSSKECLRRHIRNHLGEEHQCFYCPCKYSRTDNLYAHMKNAHGWVKPKNVAPYYSVYPVSK